LIDELGGNVETYGRLNGAIDPDYGSTAFWMSNIDLVLSPKALSNENLVYLDQAANVRLYKVRSRMGGAIQVSLPSMAASPDGLSIPDPRRMPMTIPDKVLDEGDALEFKVTPQAASVLVLSQKFYRKWKAQALVPSGWTRAETVPINGVFEGVLLPKRAQRVRLRFLPYARYAWVAHVFFLFLFSLLGFALWRKKNSSGIDGAAA
jgi:hypothetical protein